MLLATAAVPPANAAADVQVSATCSSPPPTGGAVPQVSGGFHAITPARVLDTRFTLGPIGAGCTAVVDLVSLVPAQATGVALDVIAVGAVAEGYVTVYPCESDRPLASNLNPRVGDPTPNLVLVPLQSSRRICLFTLSETDLVVDVMGWFGPSGASYHGVNPTRILDTRTSLRPDGGSGPIPGGSVVRIPVAGLTPVPGGASAVSANLTVTDPTAAGFITAFPCDAQLPLSSNGNYLAQETRATAAVVGLDGSGAVCVFVSSDLNLVVDVTGWFGGTDGTRLAPIVGTRVLDTRDGTGTTGTAPVAEGQTLQFDPTLGGTVAVGANAVLDIVAVGATESGFLTLYPCGGAFPDTSTVNYVPGAVATNAATVAVGANGKICVYAHRTTHVVVDVLGSFGPSGALRNLTVSPGPLTPDFTPDGHDYGVICGAGANNWNVTAAAVPGATVAIAGANGEGDVTLNENDAVVVTVTLANSQTQQYWVRCLPPDFPVLSASRPDDPAPGYYLMGLGLNAFSGPYAVILDSHGAVVWYRRTTTPPLNVELLPDGNLAWMNFGGVPFGVDANNGFEERSLDGTLVHTWKTSGSPTDHHDMVALANGDTMMLSYHLRSDADVSVLGGCSPGATANVLDTWIQEITPDGTVAWEWHSEDPGHIGIAETPSTSCGLNVMSTWGTPSVTALDIQHANSLDVDPTTGDVIVSFRNLSAVMRIRKTDGAILWKLSGSAPANPAVPHLQVLNDPHDGTAFQHDARLLPNGHLTAFDNESAVAGATSRAVEYALDTDAGTATLVWQYPLSRQVTAFGLGSVRRQADGSTVIGWGPLQPLVTDLGPSGDVTLEVSQSPATDNQISMNYRTVKAPVGALDLATMRATAGH